MLSDQVLAYALKHDLFEPGPALVAVSGGADSLALLHLLLTLRDKLNLTLHAATFDHGIRGEAGAADVRFVQQIAATWGIPVSTGAADVPSQARDWGMGLEESARRARYAFLTDAAHKIGSNTIATGHNQDDQAETVLMHVIRGSGLGGLRGMLPKSQRKNESPITIVRPLLDTSRAEIDAYIHDLGIEPRIDLTNTDTTYTRNRLRHEIIPAFQQINPQVKEALARTAEIARDDYATLVKTLPPLRRRPDGFSVDRALFKTFTAGQKRMIIREAILRVAPDSGVSFERVEAAIEASTKVSDQTIALGGDLWFRSTVHELIILSSRNPDIQLPYDYPHVEKGYRLSVTGTSTFTLPDGKWQLVVELIEDSVLPLLDASLLSATLAIQYGQRIELRTRQPGDRFKPHGMKGHTQKLQDTWVNMKVRAIWRDGIPLLTIDGEVAWFVAPTEKGPRARIGESFAVQPGERRPLWRFTYKLVN